MSDDIVHDSLEVDDDGFVTGSAHTREFGDGLTAVASVTSYEYERAGETKMNHVPHVVVTDADGTILAEPSAGDSPNPHTAIDNAVGLAAYVAQDPEHFDLDGE